MVKIYMHSYGLMQHIRNSRYYWLSQKAEYIKTLPECGICIWPYVRTNNIKYNCNKKKVAFIQIKCIILWNNITFNSMINLCNNALSSYMALPSSGGRGGNNFSNLQGSKRLCIPFGFKLIVDNDKLCMLCSHEHWTEVHISYRDLNLFLKWG